MTFTYRNTKIHSALEADNTYNYWALVPNGDLLTFDTLEEATAIVDFLLLNP